MDKHDKVFLLSPDKYGEFGRNEWSFRRAGSVTFSKNRYPLSFQHCNLTSFTEKPHIFSTWGSCWESFGWLSSVNHHLYLWCLLIA